MFIQTCMRKCLFCECIFLHAENFSREDQPAAHIVCSCLFSGHVLKV